MSKIILIQIMSLTCVCAATSATAAEVEFVRARLVKVDPAPNSPGISMTIAGKNPVVVPMHGAYRLTFKVRKAFLGPNLGSEFSMIRASARPIPGNEYYLFVLGRVNYDPNIIWSGNASEGICVPDELSKRYGVRDAIVRLQQDFSCRK